MQLNKNNLDYYKITKVVSTVCKVFFFRYIKKMIKKLSDCFNFLQILFMK